MHIGILLHTQVSPHIIDSTYKCHMSSPCVKWPWFLKMWWDWFHLTSVLTMSLVSVRQLGSLCSQKQALKRYFAWSLWDICMRMRGIRFWTCWFLSTDYQTSPVLCFGALVPAPQPPAPCVSYLPASLTDHSFRRKHMWAANTVSPIVQSWLIHRVLQPEIPSEGGVNCKVHLWERKRLRYLLWTAKRPETQWPWMFFTNAAQEPPNTLVCFAMISSYFYRLLFFCLNCLVSKISLSPLSSGLSVSTSCLSQDTTFQGQPAEPFTAGTNPTPYLVDPTWPYQSFAGRWPGLPQLQAAGKARTWGKLASNPNLPWDCVQTDLAASLASQELPGRNTMMSKCKMWRGEGEGNSWAFQMIWSRI